MKNIKASLLAKLTVVGLLSVSVNTVFAEGLMSEGS